MIRFLIPSEEEHKWEDVAGIEFQGSHEIEPPRISENYGRENLSQQELSGKFQIEFPKLFGEKCNGGDVVVKKFGDYR